MLKSALAWTCGFLFVVAGCAGSSETDADDSLGGSSDEVVSAPAASGEGKIDGKAVTFSEGAGHALNRIKSGSKVIASSTEVDLSSGKGMCTEWKAKAQMLALRFKNGGGDIEEGATFDLTAGSGEALGASAQFWLTDKKCEMATDKISAKSGTIKITKATPQRIVGEYDLDFGEHGSLKGTFDAPTCLKALDSASEAPACKE